MGGAESSDPTSKILITTIHYSTPKGLGEVGGDCPVFGVLGVLTGLRRGPAGAIVWGWLTTAI